MVRVIFAMFDWRTRAKVAGLISLIVLNGLLEVFGIGMLFPYVAILQNPDRITQNDYLDSVYRWVGFQSADSFIISGSIALLTVFVVKATFGIWVQSVQVRFVYARQAELGERLLAGYLRHPYEFFLTANTSNLIANLTTSLNQFCSGVIQSLLVLISELVVVGGLMTFVVFVSPTVSLFAITFIGMLALGFVWAVRSRIARYATENDMRWKAALRIANESVVAAKEIQVFNRTSFFIDAYGQEMRRFAVAVSKYSILVLMPKAMMETIAVAGMISVVVFAISTGQETHNLFALLAVFAVTTVRIVPSVNRIVQAWHSISFQRPAVDIVRSGLAAAAAQIEMSSDAIQALPLRRALKISIEKFAYPTNPTFRLRNIKLEIRQGQRVAFIGHSGSGKSTLIDLLLGLYPKFEGEIEVDGLDIRKGILAWRRNIGYIPQTIMLRDDTIAKNVAFGLPDDEIDLSRLTRAITLAGLDSVVARQADGLHTMVGDRGIRLSGGERQRVGIARALYNDPDLLVMDEATSALDNQVEQTIVNSILGMSPAKTVIVIAHRLTTVRDCDFVFLMQEGSIIDRGSFNEIIERNPDIARPRSASVSNNT